MIHFFVPILLLAFEVVDSVPTFVSRGLKLECAQAEMCVLYNKTHY